MVCRIEQIHFSINPMVNMSKSLIFICLLMSSILVLGGFLRREVDEQDKSKHYKSFLGKWEVRNQVQQYLFTIDFFSRMKN